MSSGYEPITFREYRSESPLPGKFAIIRHDIDRRVMNALDMARLEGELGIKASYYFRYTRKVFNPDILRQVAAEGHEIGYHYETMSRAGGDPEKAMELFERELGEFRRYFDVRTICMHGSPLSKFDNRDLWKTYDFKESGIIGEAYLSMGPDLDYFSDTGRSWDTANKLRDVPPASLGMRLQRIRTTDDLIRLIGEGGLKKPYILVHPERWSKDRLHSGVYYANDVLFNFGKKAVSMVRS